MIKVFNQVFTPTKIVFLLAFLPLVYVPSFQDATQAPRTLFVSIFLLLAYYVLHKSNVQIPSVKALIRNPIIISVLCFYLISVLSLSYTGNLTFGLKAVTRYSVWLLLIFLFVPLLGPSSARRNLAILISVAALMLCFAKVATYLDIAENVFLENGLMVNNNSISQFLFFGSFIQLQSLNLVKGATRILVILALFIAGLTIIWIGSIAIFVAAAISTIFILLAHFQGNSMIGFFGMFTFLVLVSGFAIVLASSPDQLQVLPLSWKERLVLWEKTLALITDTPLLGGGIGSWSISYAHYPSQIGSFFLEEFKQSMFKEMADVFHQRTHNDFLQSWAESGVFAFISIVILFFAAPFKALRGRSLISMLPVVGIFAFGIVAFFSFPLERIENLLIFAALLAMAAGEHLNERDWQKRKSALSKYWQIFTLTTMAMLTLLQIGFEQDIATLMRAKEGNRYSKIVKTNREANQRWNRLDNTATPLDWYTGMAQLKMGKTEEALYHFEKALKFNPNHVHVLNNVAVLNYRLGQTLESEQLLSRAVAINPNFAEAKNSLNILKNTNQRF